MLFRCSISDEIKVYCDLLQLWYRLILIMLNINMTNKTKRQTGFLLRYNSSSSTGWAGFLQDSAGW